jgi:peptidoglycan/LPS O-acetylase OafA/YrhL
VTIYRSASAQDPPGPRPPQQLPAGHPSADRQPRGQRSPGRHHRARLAYAPGLDGVRALAVTAVVLYHLGTTGFTLDHGRSLLAPGGFLGVDVFFVLSGFLITSLLLAERAETGRISIRTFYVRRARRLLPALYTMLLAVSVAAVFWYHDYAARLKGDLIAALAYVTNWWLIAGGSSYFGAGTHPPLLTHLWSLALEEQFYLLWPLALIGLTYVRRRGSVIVIVGVTVLASTLLAAALFSPWQDPSRIYYGTDTRLATPLLGALLAIAFRPWLWRPGTLRPAARATVTGAGMLAAIALGVACVLLTDQSPVLYRGGFLAIAALAGLLVIAAAHPDVALGRVLGVAPLRWLGERSYAIYLWHWPIFAVTQPGVNLTFGTETVGLVVTTVLRIVLTLTAAALSYRFVEKPMRAGALGRAIRSWRATAGWRRVRGNLAVAGTVLTALAVLAVVGGRIATLAPPSSAPVGPGPDTNLGAFFSPSPAGSLPPQPGKSNPPSGTPSTSATPHSGVPKVAIFGDSQGMTLLINVPKDTGKYVAFKDDTIEGCGFLLGRVTSRSGEHHDLTANCGNWQSEWTSRAARDRPDIAMIMVGAWDVFDMTVNGESLTFGTPAWDAYFNGQYQRALSALRPSVNHVAISLLPCYRPVRASAGYWPERGDDSRTRHVNALLSAAAATYSWVTLIHPPHQFCDDPKIATSLNYRWDGVHYYKPGALLYCQAVIPQLLAIKLD